MKARQSLDMNLVGVGIATLLGCIGGLVYILKGVVLALTMLTAPRDSAGVWVELVGLASMVGVIGMLGLLAASWIRWNATTAVVGQTIAGVGALLLDASGALPPPRVIPAVLLLAAAALAYMQRQPRDGQSQHSVLQLMAQVLTGFSLLAHGVVAIPFTAAGLGAPAWAVAGMFVIWGLLLVLILRLRHRLPWVIPVIPLVAYVMMDRWLLFGSLIFNWSA